MTDSRPTLANLQERIRAIEAHVDELETDEIHQEVTGLLRVLIADTAACLAEIQQDAVSATPTSARRQISEDDDAELQSLVGQLRTALESIQEVTPSQLFANLDRKIGDLDRFQRDLQPVKDKVDELVQVVGGRYGYRDVAKGFERLDQRIKILTGVVAALTVVALIAMFA